MGGQNYSVQSLHEFISYVSDKGLIKQATARNWGNAASRIFGILDDSEQSDVRNIDINAICQRYANLNGKDITPSSLKTYRSRLKSAVNDFVKYTDNPISYSPSISQRTTRKKVEKDPVSSDVQDKVQDKPEPVNEIVDTKSAQQSTYPIPVPLRENLIVQITGVPFDLTASEADKISRVIKALGVEKD